MRRLAVISVVLLLAGALGLALVGERGRDGRASFPTHEPADVRLSGEVVAVVASITTPASPSSASDPVIIGVTGRVRVRAFPRHGSESGPLAGVDVVAVRAGAPPVEVLSTTDATGAFARAGAPPVEVLSTTDATGAFALELSPGPWTISLRPLMTVDVRVIEPGQQLHDHGWPLPAADAPRGARLELAGSHVALDIRVCSEGLIAGSVVDDVTGAPIVGASIRLGATPEQELEFTSTDARGRFFVVSDRRTSMSTLPSRILLARAPAYAPGAAAPVPDSAPLVGAFTDVEVRLLRPVMLVGRVIDLDGRPVADVDLHVTAPLRSHAVTFPGFGRSQFGSCDWDWSARTGPDGTFVVEGLAPSVSPEHTEVRVEARRRGWKQVAPCIGVAGPGIAPLTVVVAPEVTVEGTVVSSAGAPIAAACVARLHRPAEVRFERETRDGPIQDRVMRGLPGGLANRRLADRYYRGLAVATWSDGRFVLEGLAPGDHDLAIRAPGHGEVILRVSAPSAGLRVVLAPGRSLRGCALDDAGAPVVGATVRAMRAGTGPGARGSLAGGWPGDEWVSADERGAAVTDAEGRFVITDLGDDSVDVLVVREAEYSGWDLLLRPEVVAFADGARTDGVEVVLRTNAPRAALDVDSRSRSLVPRPVGHVEVLVRGRPARPLRSLDVVLLQRASPPRLQTPIAREQQTAAWTSPPLEPGPVEVRVEARDWDAPPSDPAQVLATRSAQIVEGETTRVVVDLRP